jgi:hypothetical protein
MSEHVCTSPAAIWTKVRVAEFRRIGLGVADATCSVATDRPKSAATVTRAVTSADFPARPRPCGRVASPVIVIVSLLSIGTCTHILDARAHAPFV